MRTSRALEALADRIERSSALDKPAAALNTAISKVVRPGPVEDVLSGTPVGHSVHPALVAIPIGAWSSSLVLDLAGEDDAARRLIGFGLLAALPTAASGASDWLSTDGAERRVGLVHAVLNYAAIAGYAGSWFARRADRRTLGVTLAAVSAGVLGAAGWLGGHLAYAQGVGVDTTAFQKYPSDWADAGSTADLPAEGALAEVEVDGVPLLVTRRSGDVIAMADRCTHRGAPLHEGEIRNGCVICPWHDSAFSLDDGAVISGPATRPQPMMEVRVADGRLQVRRTEQRSLRTNPTGH